MKYFTRRFINGVLSAKRRQADYIDYVQKLSALSPALQTLGHLNLHDAYIIAVAHDRLTGNLQLRLRRGDERVGYADSIVIFCQSSISEKSLQMLRTAVRRRMLKFWRPNWIWPKTASYSVCSSGPRERYSSGSKR